MEICGGLNIKQDGVAWHNHSDVNLNSTVGRYNSPLLTLDSGPKGPRPMRFLYSNNTCHG